MLICELVCGDAVMSVDCLFQSGMFRTLGVDYFVEPLNSQYKNSTKGFSGPHLIYKYGSIKKLRGKESHCGVSGKFLSVCSSLTKEL